MWRFGLYLTTSSTGPIYCACKYCKQFSVPEEEKGNSESVAGLLVTNLNEHYIFYILVPYKPQEIKLNHINAPFFHVTVTFISGIFNLIRDIIS